jgi:hypothetical protein
MVMGEQWYVVEGPPVAWSSRDDGFWIWPSLQADVNTAYPLLRYPARAGETYDISAGDLHRTGTVVAIDQRVELPHGSYRCCEYLIADQSGAPVLSLWLSPGLGWVRSELYAHTPDGRTYVAQRQDLADVQLR